LPLTRQGSAGYSGAPLAKKLGLRPGDRVGLVGAPAGFEAQLAPLPDGVAVSRRGRAPLDAVVFFVTRRRHLETRHAELAARLTPSGSLWVAWPKRTSGVPTDLTEGTLREVLLPSGMVDTKVCAIDATWSGLRFVRRRELR
jgi:hypothetical protein